MDGMWSENQATEGAEKRMIDWSFVLREGATVDQTVTHRPT